MKKQKMRVENPIPLEGIGIKSDFDTLKELLDKFKIPFELEIDKTSISIITTTIFTEIIFDNNGKYRETI